MELNPYIADAVEEIDAAIFSGDQFADAERRAKMREYLARWERGLKEFDRLSASETGDSLPRP